MAIIRKMGFVSAANYEVARAAIESLGYGPDTFAAHAVADTALASSRTTTRFCSWPLEESKWPAVESATSNVTWIPVKSLRDQWRKRGVGKTHEEILVQRRVQVRQEAT